MNYLQQRASSWVSFTVLAGGLLTAGLLFFLVRVEESAHGAFSPDSYEEEYAELRGL